jgi:hypothetical protein
VALAACTTDLDPSVIPGDGVAGASGTGGSAGEGQVLATCSSFVELSAATYVICPEPMDFEAASADCLRRGATLAAVGSTQENAYIAGSANSLVNGNLWLGGTRDDDYVWRWPDGAVFWRGGPAGAPEGPERCLALTFNANNWNDRACSLRLPYVCETPTASP